MAKTELVSDNPFSRIGGECRRVIRVPYIAGTVGACVLLFFLVSGVLSTIHRPGFKSTYSEQKLHKQSFPGFEPLTCCQAQGSITFLVECSSN